MVGLGRSSSFNSAPSSSQGARLSKKTKAQTFKATRHVQHPSGNRLRPRINQQFQQLCISSSLIASFSLGFLPQIK
jgi:hypothetical protein